MKLSIEFVIFFTKCYFLVLFPKNFHIQVYHNFMEKEKNYILAKIGVGIALVVIIFWLMVLVVALR